MQKAIGRADHIPVVIDGREIASDETRSLAVLEARGLLKMLEKQARPEHARVCLVITKGDLLAGQELSEIIDAIVRGTLAEGSQHFVTADRASDRTNDVGEPLVSLGYGVGALLTHVAELPATVAVVSVEPTRPTPSPVLRRIWEGR